MNFFFKHLCIVCSCITFTFSAYADDLRDTFVIPSSSSATLLLHSPTGIATDGSDNIYIADRNNNRILKLDKTGNLLKTFSSYGPDNRQFNALSKIAVDSAGNIYCQVFESPYDYVVKMNNEGSYISKLYVVGYNLGAVDSSGNIFVSTWNNYIRRYDSNLNFLGSWGGTDSGSTQNGMFYNVGKISVGTTDTLYISDGGGHRVQKFTNSGTFVNKWDVGGAVDGHGGGASTVDRSGHPYFIDWYKNIYKGLDNGQTELLFSTTTNGPGSFSDVYDMAIDSEHTLYFSDSNNNAVQVFKNNTLSSIIGNAGVGEGKFYSPQSVALDSDKNIYVVDTGNNRIQKFDAGGNFLLQWGGYGTVSGKFCKPYGIAIDGMNHIFITDLGNNRIQKFSATGTFLGSWAFTLPRAIAIDRSGRIYAAGQIGVKRFTGDGQEDASWTNPEVGFGQALALDSSQNVYLFVGTNYCIYKYASNGALLKEWGSQGTGDGQFGMILGGAAIDNKNNIFVSDTENHRILQYDTNGKFLRSFNNSNTSNGPFFSPKGLCAERNGKLYVLDSGNHRLRIVENVYAHGTSLSFPSILNLLAVDR